MTSTTRPVPVVGYGIAVIDQSGVAVGVREFSHARQLRAWLSNWRVSLDTSGEFLRVVAVRNYPLVSEFAGYAREHDWSLRVSVRVGGASVAPESAFALVLQGRLEQPRDVAVARRGAGPIPGTGKRKRYRYFRRRIATFTERRDAVIGLEDEAPAVRCARNSVNLPDARDDILRGLTRSWKKTRRTQWRAVR